MPIRELCFKPPSNRRPAFFMLAGRETGVGASRKDTISRCCVVHRKAGRRGELSSGYRLPRQGNCRPRAASFGRHCHHSRRRRVSNCWRNRSSFSSLLALTGEDHYDLATSCNILAALRISASRCDCRLSRGYGTFSALLVISYVS